MNPIKASIIINNYNYGHFLGHAINSALDQDYPNVEVIVVDDGSTDHSQRVIASFKEVIPVYKKNAGQASCFNAGFLKSSGDVVFLLDADDFLEKNAVSKVMEQWRPEFSKMHWQLYKTNDAGKPLGKYLPDDVLAEGDLRSQLIEGGPCACGGPPNSPPTTGNAWSRAFLQQVLPMPEEDFKQGADNYLFVLAPLYGLIGKINEPLGYYRLHGRNNTAKSSYIDAYFRRFEAVAVALSEHLAKQGINKNANEWPREHWYHKVKKAMDLVVNVVPEGSAFILMDENHWVTSNDFHGRKRIPFVEMDGEFGGPPGDDSEAIEEIEKKKSNGAAFVVVPWSCFWYLQHYSGMKQYLENNAKCRIKNELIEIYDLNSITV